MVVAEQIPETSEALSPPSVPPRIATVTDFDDETRDLRDRISGLTVEKTKELIAYLKLMYGIAP